MQDLISGLIISSTIKRMKMCTWHEIRVYFASQQSTFTQPDKYFMNCTDYKGSDENCSLCNVSAILYRNTSTYFSKNPTNAIPTLLWWWGLSAPETLRAIPAVA
jgi:hypothetical protein